MVRGRASETKIMKDELNEKGYVEDDKAEEIVV